MMEMLKNKHLLLDTNVLISIIKNGDQYLPFFKKLEELEVASVIDYAIKFEFLRGSNTREDLEKKEKYLDLLFGENRLELMTNTEIFENAREISNIYSRKNYKLVKQITFGDCLIAAQMKKYNENHSNLFLATIDNNDFPLFIFDRIYVYTIDTQNEIINLGIYSFNKDKYEKLKSEFWKK